MAVLLRRNKYIVLFSYLVLIAAVLTLVGWQFDITILKSMLPGKTPMNPVTAATFLISSFWLGIFARKPESKYLLFSLATLVTAIGAIHFITYIFPNPSIRLDYLFYGDKIQNSHISNLIAPNTALLFLLSGICMLTVNTASRTMLLTRQAFIFIGFSIVYISLVGYLYSINYAYTFQRYTPMALPTTVVFLFLNTALLFSNVEIGISKLATSNLSGSRMFKQVIGFLLLLPIVLGYFRIFGEKQGLYPSEFGTGIYTLIFAFAEFIFIYLYAVILNRQQLDEIKGKAKLEASEHKFRTLFTALQQGIYTIDTKGIVLFCNPVMRHLTGFTESELRNHDIINMVVSQENQHYFYDYLVNTDKNKRQDFETQVIRKDGQKIWVRIKLVPFAEEDGFVTQYMVTVIDITEQKVRQEDLMAFTASAAHDLSSPISRISMALSLLETNNLTEEQLSLINAVSETAVGMKQLLDDLLAFSKLGTLKLERHPVDLNAMVRDICEQEKPAAFKGHITQMDLPPAYGNDGAIKQLFTNLISNAIKYSSKKPEPDVEIGAIQNEGAAFVYFVKDNGVGLKPANIENLFIPFKRFHSGYDGNGMGLAIVKRVVDKHGGKIWVDSIAEKGSTFFFTLESN